MINPAELKRDPDRPYLFKSPLKTRLMRWVDVVGKILFGGRFEPVPWNDVRKIAVLRLDHLGDVLLALPALKALEEALPKAQVDFFIGPWAKGVVDIAGLRSTLKIFSASWFAREGVKKGTWASIGELQKLLEAGKYDAVLTLRGDFRHILAIYRAGIKARIGCARTGFGFLLTHPLDHRPGLHETKRNLDLFEQAGIQLSKQPGPPRLYPCDQDDQAQREVRKKLGITRPVIAIHATCLAPAKRWSVANWQNLIDRLPEKNDIVLIGTEGEKAEMEEIQKGCERKVFLTAGLLNLPALAAFLKECALLIGVDSGPAHIAAAVGTPVVVLYSGTNVADQWRPQGSRVTVLQKTPPCSPCELIVCPIGNECMNQITVDEVLKAVNSIQ